MYIHERLNMRLYCEGCECFFESLSIMFVVVRHVIVVHFVEKEIWIALLYACNNRIMLLLCFLVECIPICPNFKGIRNMQGE